MIQKPLLVLSGALVSTATELEHSGTGKDEVHSKLTNSLVLLHETGPGSLFCYYTLNLKQTSDQTVCAYKNKSFDPNTRDDI